MTKQEISTMDPVERSNLLAGRARMVEAARRLGDKDSQSPIDVNGDDIFDHAEWMQALESAKLMWS